MARRRVWRRCLSTPHSSIRYQHYRVLWGLKKHHAGDFIFKCLEQFEKKCAMNFFEFESSESGLLNVWVFLPRCAATSREQKKKQPEEHCCSVELSVNSSFSPFFFFFLFY